MMNRSRDWIDDLEIENAQVKWGFSHFDGREDGFNAEGDHNFTIIIDPAEADRLREIGWNVKEREGYEEGDPPENTLKVNISFKYGPPTIYFIKGQRKFRIEERKELADIKRSTCENIDVIISPSRWVRGDETGVSAYVKEMYVTIAQSRFSERYADYEAV